MDPSVAAAVADLSDPPVSADVRPVGGVDAADAGGGGALSPAAARAASIVFPAGGGGSGGSDGSVDGGGDAVEAVFAAAEGAPDDPPQAATTARAASSLFAAGGDGDDAVGGDGPAESVQTGPPLSAAVTRGASTSVPVGAGGGTVGGGGSAGRWRSEPLPVTASDSLLAAAAAADAPPPTAAAPTARVVDTDGSSDDTTVAPAAAPPAAPSAPRSSADAANTPSSAAATVGAVYVLNEDACTERLAWVRERARAAAGLELPLTILNAVAGRAVSLDAPPLPVARVAAGSWVTGGLVAATASHVAAWRRAVTDGHAVVAVVEDDTFPTAGLVERLPALVRTLDVGSAAAGKPWHIAFLTRHPVGDGAEEVSWAGGGDGAPAAAGATPPTSRRVTVANHSGGGTSAYLLSAAGARYLLGQVTTYTAPLDEALATVSGLVALSACDAGAPADGCPGNVVRARRADVGGCDTAAAGVGERRRGEAFADRAAVGGEGDVSAPVPTPPPAVGEVGVRTAAGAQATAAMRVGGGEVGRATAAARDPLADPAPFELVHWYTPAEAAARRAAAPDGVPAEGVRPPAGGGGAAAARDPLTDRAPAALLHKYTPAQAAAR